MPDLESLSRVRGVYADRAGALDAAKRVPRGFVRSESESKHVVYEAAWQPLAIGRLTVDLEHETGEWQVVIAAQDDVLLAPGVLAVRDTEARWLSMVALPAVISLIDRIELEHDVRLRGLRW